MVIFYKGSRLFKKLKAFHKEIGETIYFNRLSLAITNEQLEEAIDKSLEAQQNLIPDIIGYVYGEVSPESVDIEGLNKSFLEFLNS